MFISLNSVSRLLNRGQSFIPKSLRRVVSSGNVGDDAYTRGKNSRVYPLSTGYTRVKLWVDPLNS